jgi:hypothetical protein
MEAPQNAMVALLTPYTSTTLLSSQIPINENHHEYPMEYVVLYSVAVPNLTPNSVVVIKSQFQVQGLYKYYVGIGRSLIRATSPTDTSGVTVTETVMTNLQPEFQNEAVVINGTDSNIPAGDYYYNLVGYSLGSGELHHGLNLTVIDGAGDITAVVFQNPD